MVNFRMDGGTVGRLWTSSVAIGRQHGLRHPGVRRNGRLALGVRNSRTSCTGRRSAAARRSSNGARAGFRPRPTAPSRVAIGHAEGMPLAFANIYCDLAEAIRGDGARRRCRTAAAETGCGRWRRCMPRSASAKAGGRLDRRPAADVPLDRQRAATSAARRCWQGNSRDLGRTVGVVDRGDHKFDGGLDDVGDRLADRRQVDVRPARHLHVVQPEEPDIAAAPTAPRPRPRSARPRPAGRRRRNRPRPAARRQQALHLGPARIEGIVLGEAVV